MVLVSAAALMVAEGDGAVPTMQLPPPRPGEKANGCGGLAFLLLSSVDMTSTNWPHSPTRPEGADWDSSRGDMTALLVAPLCSPLEEVWEKQGLVEPPPSVVLAPLTLPLLHLVEVETRRLPPRARAVLP